MTLAPYKCHSGYLFSAYERLALKYGRFIRFLWFTTHKNEIAAEWMELLELIFLRKFCTRFEMTEYSCLLAWHKTVRRCLKMSWIKWHSLEIFYCGKCISAIIIDNERTYNYDS